MSVPDRRGRLVREGSGLSLLRQCALLGLVRSGVFRQPQAANANDLARHGKPEIFNTDQGLQFTSCAFTFSLDKAGIAKRFNFYNRARLHQALGYGTPMAVWEESRAASMPVDMMVA